MNSPKHHGIKEVDENILLIYKSFFINQYHFAPRTIYLAYI